MIASKVKSEIEKLQPSHFINAFPNIFSWRELENLLNLRPFVNHQRLKFINKEEYSWNNQGWLTDVNTYPPTLLERELRTNLCSIIDASRVNKKVNSICKELESTFTNSCVDAHIYFTVAEDLSRGFGIHWDNSHNLIVQVEGSSRFQIWGCDVKEKNVEHLEESPLIEVVMSSGDAIFVPMKVYHRAISLSKRLSISFPISYETKFEPQDRHWVEL